MAQLNLGRLCSRYLDKPRKPDGRGRRASKEGVAVIQVEDDHCLDEVLCCEAEGEFQGHI